MSADGARTCVGCRRPAPRGEMVRIAATPDGWRVGTTEPGRGAWICSRECVDTALRRGALARALRSAPPEPPTYVLAELRARLRG